MVSISNMVTYMTEESPHLLLLLLLQGQYCAGLESLTIIKYSSIAPQQLSELVYAGTKVVVVNIATDGLQLLLVNMLHYVCLYTVIKLQYYTASTIIAMG